MRFVIARVLPALGILLLASCSSTRPLPKFEKPLARAAVMSVRTTAYTHTESDHLQHGRQTALGTILQNGPIHSAAADWSRWPAGSIFRIRETGEIFEVDDYGWALAGTNTIDLYKPSRAAMNAWGVRRVTLENLRWGDPKRSLAILRSRSRYRHVKRMADQLEDRMPEWVRAQPAGQLTSVEIDPVPAVPVNLASSPTPSSATSGFQPNSAAARPARTASSVSPTATREAFLNSYR